MTAAGEAVLAVAYTQIGVTEDPPGSNQVIYNEGWTDSAWCATFVSWCCTQAGYPLPAINGPQGFSYCPSGQEWGYRYDGSNVDPEPGDVLIFSWEPWHLEGGIAICSSGAYAGSPAGDHTGFWAGGGYTVEGNTSRSSWDNGGAVMERGDRYSGQICCVWRPAVIAAGGPSEGEDEMTEADFERIQVIVHETVLGLWREAEMANLDTSRAEVGAHHAGEDIMRSEEYGAIVRAQAWSSGLDLMRSEENGAIIEAACRRAIDGQ